MATIPLLDQREEDELHKSRILNVEEKPFKRITKRLLTPNSLTTIPTKLPTPPPDSTSDESTTEPAEDNAQKQLEELKRFREDVLLDFAAFDSSIARIQFLRNSNERERERYAAEKVRIMEAAQAVKDNTAQLRVQLESARATMNQRKKFDELAEKITSNRLLRPREDQEINLMKLEEECKELDRESQQYAETWKERREQFGRIVEEGIRLRRLIRDEKEEVERREGMDDGGEEDGEVGETASRGGATPKHSSQSGNATPRPDGGMTPRPQSAGSTSTPANNDGEDSSRQESLRPKALQSEEGSRTASRAASPAGVDQSAEQGEEGEDIPMTEAANEKLEGADQNEIAEETPEAPQVTVSEPVDMALGEAVPEASASTEDKMDTT